MARNNRGISLLETLTSLVLFASISATATSLFLTFNRYYIQSLKDLDRARVSNQIINTIRNSRLSDMILPSTTGPYYTPNGPIHTEFSTSTISAHWTWGKTKDFMARVEPQLYGLIANNSICVPDFDAAIDYNKDTQVLTFAYRRTSEGDVLQCLGGVGSLATFGPYTWKNVQEVEVLKSDDSGLTLWIKYSDEWFSLVAGEIE